jgi:hypothetical protein
LASKAAMRASRPRHPGHSGCCILSRQQPPSVSLVGQRLHALFGPEREGLVPKAPSPTLAGQTQTGRYSLTT